MAGLNCSGARNISSYSEALTSLQAALKVDALDEIKAASPRFIFPYTLARFDLSALKTLASPQQASNSANTLPLGFPSNKRTSCTMPHVSALIVKFYSCHHSQRSLRLYKIRSFNRQREGPRSAHHYLTASPTAF